MRASRARDIAEMALPSPVTDGPVSLERALGRRRSQRSFTPGPLPLADIGQLLWAGQGITGPSGGRTAPSAGALYPLELHVATADGVMRYLPTGHRVEMRDGRDVRPGLAAASGQAMAGAAPIIIVVVADLAVSQRRYGDRAEPFAELEAGHVAQNILLEAAARGLAAVPVGSFSPSRAAAALTLPAGRTVLYLIPAGLAA